MVHNEFPRLHRPTAQSREVLRMLRYRQKLIKLRTMAKNSCRPSPASRLGQGKRLLLKWASRSSSAEMSQCAWQRDHWFALMKRSMNNCWRQWSGAKLKAKMIWSSSAYGSSGIGLLTSLCLLHTLQQSVAFAIRKVVAYAGFRSGRNDPRQSDSTFWGISKAGSRLLRYLLWRQPHRSSL